MANALCLFPISVVSPMFHQPRSFPPVWPQLPILGLLLVLVASCGGGGGGGGSSPDPAPGSGRMQVTSYWDAPANTAIKETGEVALNTSGAPTDRKEGRWEFTFAPASGGGRQATLVYVQGVWDRTQQWREWNADGSIRNDWQDR